MLTVTGASMKRIIAIVLIVLGAAVVVTSAGYFLLMQAVENPGSEPLPNRLVMHPIVAQITGSQAISEINQMHGKVFLLTSGAVGVYGEERQATLWISGAPGGWMAKQILIQMRDKIAEGNSPFTPIAERNINGRLVYELDGWGQKHFYFQSGDLIVWLAANGEDAEQALAESLAFYP
jgi:hypothetical protein